MRAGTRLRLSGLATAFILGTFMLGLSRHSAQVLLARPAKPVVRFHVGVPDTIWALLEAAASGSDRHQNLGLLKKAEGLARDRLAGHEADVERRFALAAVLGLRTDRERGTKKVRAASELHRELVLILELDPGHAGARHLLGRLHAGVLRMNGATRWIATNLLGGKVLEEASWAEAEKNLAFAATRAPEVADHHLQLANLYRDTNRPELALEEVDRALSLTAGSTLERAVMDEARRLKTTLTSRIRSGPAAPPGRP